MPKSKKESAVLLSHQSAFSFEEGARQHHVRLRPLSIHEHDRIETQLQDASTTQCDGEGMTVSF
jgi:hypothetical protein